MMVTIRCFVLFQIFDVFTLHQLFDVYRLVRWTCRDSAYIEGSVSLMIGLELGLRGRLTEVPRPYLTGVITREDMKSFAGVPRQKQSILFRTDVNFVPHNFVTKSEHDFDVTSTVAFCPIAGKNLDLWFLQRLCRNFEL